MIRGKSTGMNVVQRGLKLNGITYDRKERFAAFMSMANQAYDAMADKKELPKLQEFFEITHQIAESSAKGCGIWKQDLAVAMLSALEFEPFQIIWSWSAYWRASGFPRVCWRNPQYVASILATSGFDRDPKLLEVARPPWTAFYIDIPEDLIFVTHSSGIADPLLGVMVYHDERGWNYFAESRQGAEIWRFGYPTESLLDETTKWLVEEYETPTAMDERANILIGRLILGTCLTLSNPDKVRATSGKAARKNAGRAFGRLQTTQNWVIGSPVLVDVRDEVAQWSRQGSRSRSSPSVRTLVRGHWRNQACGAKMQDHKVIHIEPYFRGPEDGPLVVRDHLIK